MHQLHIMNVTGGNTIGVKHFKNSSTDYMESMVNALVFRDDVSQKGLLMTGKQLN